MHVHLDPVGGVAGDMFIAAALDAWPEYTDELLTALDGIDLPPGWTPQLTRAQQHGVQGCHYSLVPPIEKQRFPSGHYAKIRERLQQSPLTPAVKQHALSIFKLLAEAEAHIHGVAIDNVHFHELADWDSIVDIVAAAWLIDRIGADSWSIAPLPIGGGLVDTEHGPLPVPAPATALLLQGFEMLDDGIPGERVTPTGAAILQYLQRTYSMDGSNPLGRLTRQGFGMGTRTLPDRANVLRLLACETMLNSTERVAVISFEIDDQTSEDLALALDRLRSLEGVLEITQMPVYGKKGRLVSHVQILAKPMALHDICRQCLIETTTIGLRWRIEQRYILTRELHQIDTFSVKTVTRPDGNRTAKADIDALRGQSGYLKREQRRRDMERKALGDADGG